MKLFLFINLITIGLFIQGCANSTIYKYDDMQIVGEKGITSGISFYSISIQDSKRTKLYIKLKNGNIIKCSLINKNNFKKIFEHITMDESEYGFSYDYIEESKVLFYTVQNGYISYGKNIYSPNEWLICAAFSKDIFGISIDGKNFYSLPIDKETLLKLFGKPNYIEKKDIPLF